MAGDLRLCLFTESYWGRYSRERDYRGKKRGVAIRPAKVRYFASEAHAGAVC